MSRTTTIAAALALAAPLTALNSALGDAMRCSNAYHPFGPTVQREYQLISNDVGNSSYRESFLDFAGDSFIHQIDYAEGGSLQAGVNCAGDGSLSVAPRGMTLDGEVIPMFSGALLELSLPPEAEWQLGKTWTHRMEFGAGLPVGMGVATMANEIVGPDTVTVPAGTFDALKVETLVDQQMTLDLPGVGKQSMDLSHRATSWYVKGIGMVKTVSDEPDSMTIELVGYRQ